MNDTYTVNKQEFVQAVEAVRAAQSPDEERSTLETLARLLFEGVSFLTCKYANTGSTISEIEMVVQYDGWGRSTAFDGFGRYFLVACKNWTTPVRARDLQALQEKMQKSRVRLGILLAPTGICGRRKGGQAVREIRRAFDLQAMCTVVLSCEHLNHVANGTNFYDMLEYLIERTRFDFI